MRQARRNMICIFCSRQLANRKTCRNNIGQVAAAQLCESGQYAAITALVARTMREVGSGGYSRDGGGGNALL